MSSSSIVSNLKAHYGRIRIGVLPAVYCSFLCGYSTISAIQHGLESGECWAFRGLQRRGEAGTALPALLLSWVLGLGVRQLTFGEDMAQAWLECIVLGPKRAVGGGGTKSPALVSVLLFG